jgi:iron complex transport system permease protein
MISNKSNRSAQPFWPWVAVLSAALAMLVLAATGMGFLSVSFADVARIIISAIPGMPDLSSHLDRILPVVIRDVRLPRILCAAIVGGGLSMSGAVFQGILLNPLADPYTLGVSAGAAFGASVAFLLKLGAVGISLCAFLGAMLTLVFVLYLASTTGGFSSTNLILAGIITAAILSAGISFLKYIADEQVSLIIFWLMGSFASRTWYDAGITLAVVLLGFLVLMLVSRDINLLVLGERTAASLGVHPQRVIAVSMVTASLVAAVCVSVSGIIGFVGLLVPHIVRSLFGPDHRRLIPISLLMGAIALLGADTVTRAILPKEIPIGVVTALTGGPFFCYVLKKKRMGTSAWSGE